MTYTEEREFTLRFELRCEFPDDYDGDLDGYAWMKAFPAIAAEAIRAAAAAAAAGSPPRWNVHTKNRGRSSDDEVTLVLTRAV